MPKFDQSPDDEPKTKRKDELAPQHDQGPSFTDLMMLVFSGPIRLDDADEAANEDEDETEPAAEGEGETGEKAK